VTQDFIKFGVYVLTGSENVVNLALGECVYCDNSSVKFLWSSKARVKWRQQMIIHDRVLLRFPISVRYIYIIPNVV